MFFLIFLIGSVCSQVATPPRKVGLPFIRSNRPAKVHLEVFLDLICSDSKEAWPHVKDVANYYSPEKVALTVHLFPVPYHQNTYYASRATFVVHYLTNGTKTFAWIDKILLEKLGELTDAAFHNNSDADLLRKLAGYASQLGVDEKAFIDLTDRRRSNMFESYTRVMWKHACVRGVAETPTYIVNGIIQPNIQQSWTLTEWKRFLDPLLQKQTFDDIDELEDNHQGMVTQATCSGDNAGPPTAMIPGSQLLLLAVALSQVLL